jgi:hypothetical protein
LTHPLDTSEEEKVSEEEAKLENELEKPNVSDTSLDCEALDSLSKEENSTLPIREELVDETLELARELLSSALLLKKTSWFRRFSVSSPVPCDTVPGTSATLLFFIKACSLWWR